MVEPQGAVSDLPLKAYQRALEPKRLVMKQGITMKYDKIHMVLGEGNFVPVASEGKLGGKHTAFYDLFRVEGGKIAEHWDTIEPIPEKKDWKNVNGKF